MRAVNVSRRRLILCFSFFSVANNEVEFNDLISLLAAWGPCGGCPEDLNGNGEVDFNDLIELLASWGPCA